MDTVPIVNNFKMWSWNYALVTCAEKWYLNWNWTQRNTQMRISFPLPPPPPPLPVEYNIWNADNRNVIAIFGYDVSKFDVCCRSLESFSIEISEFFIMSLLSIFMQNTKGHLLHNPNYSFDEKTRLFGIYKNGAGTNFMHEIDN